MVDLAPRIADQADAPAGSATRRYYVLALLTIIYALNFLDRTIFNVLGPLTNPAGAPNQVMGVYARHLVRPIAEVLQVLGSEHVLVVHSADGLDEISSAAETFVAELKDGAIREYTVTPEQFKLERVPLEKLKVATVEQSLEKVKLALTDTCSAEATIVALNAGAAIYAANLCATLEQGVHMAEDIIGTGLGYERLKELVSFTEQLERLNSSPNN